MQDYDPRVNGRTHEGEGVQMIQFYCLLSRNYL